MNELEAKNSLKNILDELDICNGDCVMLGIDMSKIPLPYYHAELNKNSFREREQKWFNFVFKILIDQLGSLGTLLVPTYTYSYSKAGSIYFSDTAKSEVGPFTEFFRTQPNVIRSLHPIFSISGIGKYAGDLLTENSSTAFAEGSPFSRFEKYSVKFLCLGVEFRNPLTFIHYLEQNFGVFHRYNKRFDVDVFNKDGCKLDRDWSAFVAFRGINYKSDLTSLQIELFNRNKLKEIKWNDNFNHMAQVKDVIKIGNELLMNDSLSFVNRKLKLHFNDENDDKENKEEKGILIITAK